MSDMTGLHIVIVPSWWPSPEQPGAGIFFADYAHAFASAGAKVGVIVPDLVSLRHAGRAMREHSFPVVPRVTEERSEGVPVIRIRGFHTALNRPAWQMSRFRSWLERGIEVYRSRYGEPDVLHAMCAIPAGWACTQSEDRLAERVVVTEHTGPFSLAMTPASNAPFVREALGAAAAIVAVSHLTCSQMRAAAIPGEIHVCGNPVADVYTTRAITKRRSRGSIRALFVGRLAAEKGVGELLEAIRRIDSAEMEWHFVGDGPMADDIAALAGSAPPHAKIKLHGQCDRSEVADQLARRSFLVLPSYGESFGMVVAEALCMGLPVITTRGTACADFVGDEDGLLIAPRDAEALIAGIRQMIEDNSRFDRAAIAARARERFAAAHFTKWYAHLFRKVLAEKSGE